MSPSITRSGRPYAAIGIAVAAALGIALLRVAAAPRSATPEQEHARSTRRG